jgi:hypothetical protein
MKKIITISMLAATLAATSAFGQGWLTVSGTPSQVWDGFTTAGVSARSSQVSVGLFWAAANTANPMLGLLANTPSTGNSTTPESYTVATAWSTILGAAGWTFAQSPEIGGNGVITRSSTKGAVIFNAGGNFSLTGAAAGTHVALMEVSWNAAFASPSAAQTGGSAIGWTYLTADSGALGNAVTDVTSPQITANGPSFGTFIPAVASVPEPSTMALAALGGASLLLFRRRK